MDDGQVTVRGIPIPQVEIDAVEWNHGQFAKANLVPDSEVLLIHSLDHVLARLRMAGLDPPFIQLAERPFERFWPVPIKMNLPGGIAMYNKRTKPVGFIGWVREKKIIIGGIH